MEKRTNSPYPSHRPARDGAGRAWCSSSAPALFMWSDRAHDWRYYQMEFTRMVAEQLGDEKAADVPTGLQQIWVADLERADRCTTCHQAISWKGFEKAEHPYRTHPEAPLKTHPVEDFGCTSCHGGQGWAIDTAAAHGEVAHWEEPLLSRSLGEEYTLAGDKNALMQMNCNTCHRYDRETTGATAINLAKRLVNEKGCRACHVDQRLRRHHRPGPDRGRREGARAVRLQPALGTAHRVCVARRPLQGPARAGRGHHHAQLQLHHRAGAGAVDAGAVVAAPRRAGPLPGRRAAHRSAQPRGGWRPSRR